MAKSKAEEDEPSLWDVFKDEPLDVIDEPAVPKVALVPDSEPEDDGDIEGFDRDDLARLTMQGFKDLDKAIEDRIKFLTTPVKAQKPAKVAKIEAVATTEPEDTTPVHLAVPKGIVNDLDRKLYLSIPYYGHGGHELKLWRAWKGDPKAYPTVEEYDKLVFLLGEWMKKDWCNMTYGVGCPVFLWGEGKDTLKRHGMLWRRLNRKFWKMK